MQYKILLEVNGACSIVQVDGVQKGPHEILAFTGDPNVEHVDEHHNGHLQDRESNCRRT